MTAPEEPVNGPVIRDNRRIDPVTGQPRRGKHAASQPAGGSASRPGGPGSARHGKDGDKDIVMCTHFGARAAACSSRVFPTTGRFSRPG